MMLASCIVELDHGYPGKVTFTRAGVEQTVKCKSDFYDIEIIDYDNGGRYTSTRIGGMVITKNSWLTAKSTDISNKVTLKAEPLPIGREPRTVTVYLEFKNNESTAIEIIQK